jgi:membrane protease YdiL (CAAX protease family)
MPALPYIERQYGLLEGPEPLWFAIIAIGGLSEELWRSLSLLSLERAADSAFFPIVATSAAFAIGRLGGIPGRGSGEVVDVGSEFVTGLLLGGLFVWSGSILATSIANIVFYASSFLYLRRRYHSTVKSD